MAKDAKGHGSWGHEEHHAESQRLMKERAGLIREGKKREATDMMAKAKEHADMARHLLVQQRRQASGQTMKQRMASGTAPDLGRVRSTTQNKKY